MSFPHFDPLPGKTEFGRADSLPYYWDYEDIDPKKKGVQGITGGTSDLQFSDKKQDGVDEFWDGPVDKAKVEIEFATFLVQRPDSDKGRVLTILGGFGWTFNEGPKCKGFNNDDEFISNLNVIKVDEVSCKLITTALKNSGFKDWQVKAR